MWAVCMAIPLTISWLNHVHLQLSPSELSAALTAGNVVLPTQELGGHQSAQELDDCSASDASVSAWLQA
jgi:hypothetical protein